MSKKSRQRDPNNGDESSDSGEEAQNVECSHIPYAVNVSRVKKIVQNSGFLTDCELCKKLPPDNDMSDLGFEYDMSLWLCLQCGHQSCGRARNQHALKHYETPHSDSHQMCVNTTTWSVWCYGCDNEVNVTCKRRLQEAVEYLKRQAETNKIKQRIIGPPRQHTQEMTPLVSNSTASNEQAHSTQSNKTVLGLNLPRPRGLTNLGNTCFFNSVMQCLGQTPYLRQLLFETQSSGQSFKVPGGKLQLGDKQEIELPPLEGEAENWRALTQTLAETLSELQSGRAEVYNPRFLLSKLTMRMPQFGGGDQHDAHELLRHLLEAVREDDLKRFYTVILEKMGLTSKTCPTTVPEDKRKIVKFYGAQVSEMLLATEQVFRGVLVSTLQCQVCAHVSHRDEYFLDLSLPICEKQVAPVLRRKAEEIEDAKPSKYQIKKEKRAERKKNKKQKHNKSGSANTSSQPSNSPMVSSTTVDGNEEEDNDEDVAMGNDNKSESESDADVEDNAEDPGNNFWAPMKGAASHKGTESGYNSDKIDNSSPDSNNHRAGSPADIGIDDSGVPSPSAACAGACPSVSPTSPDSSPASSETNVDMGSPLLGNNSADEDYGEADTSSYQTRPMSRLAFTGSNSKSIDLKENLEKLILNDGDTSKVSSTIKEYDVDACVEGASAVVESVHEKMEEGDVDVENDDDYENDKETDDIAVWSGTLAARYVCEEGECSVESCLNQFTECELMMGANKVGCDLCTKRHGGPQKKTVYTEASKQLLIYNPPAVLILHLKRFQVHRFRSAKVSKFVKFSTMLNLAPFMSKRSQSLPTFYLGQNKVLYSLYGVVEHSGSIHGGHYVAYIKVRPQLDEQSPRWNFIPKNQKRYAPSRPDGEPEPPPGKWYYISDSYVSEVSESKVLSAQAYLLFYERIV